MNLLLQRLPSDEHRTHGDLYIDGQWCCYTLEDVVRDEKIKGETAIPAGTYRITMEHSPRFGANTITVNKVPNYVGVRVHGGMSEKHTAGCPLVGMERTETGIRNCKPALDELKLEIAAALQAGEDVWLEVRNAEA
jgi:hypothetical protein